MKFCRACGTALVGGSGPQPMPMAMGGAPMMSPPPLGLTPQFSGGAVVIPPTLPPAQATLPPPSLGMVPTAPGVGAPPARASTASIACPRCGTMTPVGFAFCQACGLHMQGLQPTDPGAGIPPRPVSQLSTPALQPPAPMAPAMPMAPPIDPLLATIAADARSSPLASATSGWGSAVLVNRDGSDGQRFPLAGEYTVVGRAGADVAFDDDRFLARQHARIERAGDGSVKIKALDLLNGVFRKTDATVELVDGAIVLVGREVLRFERVDADEKVVNPLIRHGVALFGSPPREPWGRLVQIIPSGGYRDVRHMATDEIVLGREEGDIVFKDDAFMSRRHAAINWDGKRATLTDLGSSNGTFVRISGTTSIKHGDHVRMGDQLLRIEIGR